MSYWPWNLKYWDTGEFQVVLERLKDLDRAGVKWNPPRKELFNNLRRIKREDVKVVIIGQDPYPNRRHATGIPFCIPQNEDFIPPTLSTILTEYETDLEQKAPWDNPDLSIWLSRGVLLWNIIPTCTVGASLSHQWDEYKYLTWEILDKLADQPVVIACLGGYAANVLREQDYQNFSVITVSHPSPRASKSSNSPFIGSKLFSRINTALRADWALEPIDWTLGDGKTLERKSSPKIKSVATFTNTSQEFFKGLPSETTGEVCDIEIEGIETTNTESGISSGSENGANQSKP